MTTVDGGLKADKELFDGVKAIGAAGCAVADGLVRFNENDDFGFDAYESMVLVSDPRVDSELLGLIRICW